MIIETTASNEAESLKSNWKSIDESRSQIAKQVFQLATALSGTKRKQLNSIGQWFDGSGDYEAALERPDVLCFCLPWLETMLSKQTQGPLTEAESVAAIGKGFCKFESNAPAGVNLIPLLYPLIAFLAWLAMVTFGSIFILPEFRRMFEEFGIELPATRRESSILVVGWKRTGFRATPSYLFAWLFSWLYFNLANGGVHIHLVGSIAFVVGSELNFQSGLITWPAYYLRGSVRWKQFKSLVVAPRVDC